MNAIAASNLTKRYGRTDAVSNVGFEIASGEIVGFVGPNGAGKTTTLRMLAGLIRPTEGRASILGKPVPGSVLSEVGTMIEEPSFYPYMTGKQNLQHAAALHGNVPPQRIGEALEFVKLENAAEKKVKAYSQGMRQRLALARSLLWHPKVLLLDEPTNGLDPTGIAEFRESLKQVASTGATVLISSHILAEVEKIVSRVLAIDKGALRFDGTLSQLIAQAGGQHVRYNVRAQDGPGLLQALRDLGYEPTAAGADGALVDVPQTEADDLLYRLTSAGVRVTSATPTAENLESAYLRLVGVDGKPS